MTTGLQAVHRTPNGFTTLVLLSLLSACGGGTLQRSPATPILITGNWVFVPEQSDDVLKVIKAALPQPKSDRQRHDDRDAGSNATGDDGSTGGHGGRGGRGGQGGRSGRSGGGDSGTGSPRADEPQAAYGHIKPLEFVKAFVWPPAHLTLLVSPDQVQINGDGRVRNFEPGSDVPYSISDRYGSRAIHAGFQNISFVVRAQDGSRLNVEETFTRDHEYLLETIKFQARGIRSIKVSLKYRQATALENSIPLDGPPAPSAR